MTNLDVLGYLDEIPICTAYELEGERTEQFPVSAKLVDAKPVLETMPGWKSDISQARSFDELPEAAKQYVLRLEDCIGVPIRYISVGPKREQMMQL